MFSSFVSMLTTFNRFSSTIMTDSSFLVSVFFSNLRFTGSSGGGTSVIGRFGDLAINRLFTNTFSCVSVRFSPRLELDVAAVSGSGRRLLHHFMILVVWLVGYFSAVIIVSRSLLRLNSLVHVLLVPLWDLMHHLLSSTSASVGSGRLL